MIKIISKKEYENLHSIIKTQNNQIEELIGMVREAQSRASHATKCYCDLVKLIDENVQSLPQEAIDMIDEINKLIVEDEG